MAQWAWHIVGREHHFWERWERVALIYNILIDVGNQYMDFDWFWQSNSWILIGFEIAEREKAFVWHLAGCTYRTRQFGIELPHKSWKIFRLWFELRTCGNRRWVHEGVELKHCNSEGIIPHIRGNATSLQCLSHSVIVKLKLAIIIMVWRIHWKSVLISFLSLIASGQHTQFGTKMYIFVPHSVRQYLLRIT